MAIGFFNYYKTIYNSEVVQIQSFFSGASSLKMLTIREGGEENPMYLKYNWQWKLIIKRIYI